MQYGPGSKNASRPVCLMLWSICLLLALTASAVAQDVTKYPELPRFGQVSEHLYRGGQPRPGGLRRLAELGVNTVINLRGTDNHTRSDKAEAEALGLKYFNMPLSRWGRPNDSEIRRVLEIIDAPESGRVFIHCRDGLDRTGTITAIYRITREGWTPRDALAEADRLGMRRIQFWMRDYVEDYPLQINEEDLRDRIGTGVRIVESKTFMARKVGGRVLRRMPGAVGSFVVGIF